LFAKNPKCNLHFGIALWNYLLYNKGMKKNDYNAYIIKTGIGLQDVDNLKNSAYFIKESKRYIKGEISLDELDKIITSYYANKSKSKDRCDEADKVSIRIADIIKEKSFSFSTGQLFSIHKFLFKDILSHPGEIRKYNFSKKEWVLDYESVTYGDYRNLNETLQYDFEQEWKFNYSGLTKEEIVEHLAIFISNLWQNHVFEEGNTRTTATFFIKYLRHLGFDVANDSFEKNAWYFRNALVRANYTNLSKGIYEDKTYLIKFLKNLILGERNELHNRDLHISKAVTNKKLSKSSKVLELISSNPKITSIDLSKQLKVSLRTIKNIIKMLVLDKKIKRINGKRFGYWKILDK